MGNVRDWRDSFSQLELAREQKQARMAVNEAVSGILSLAQPVAEMELILPATEALAKPKAPAKRKAKPKQAKAARKPAAKRVRKAGTRKKQAVRKPASKSPKPKAPSPRREAAAAKLAEALAVKLAETPAIPLPDLSTPLATPIAAPVEPLPRKASIAHYRKGGLIEAIGFWLRSTGRRFKAKLGASKALAKAAEPMSPSREIEELKAENERLRRQLDALLALSDAAQFKFQS